MRCAASIGRGLAIICLALLLAWPGLVLALRPDAAFRDYAIDNWHVNSGLPQVSVLSIVQDRTGYIWIGTQAGIARFDGLRFTVYDRQSEAGVDTTDASSSLADRQGRLWFGTPRGLLRHADGVFRLLNPAGRALAVQGLAEAADGTLWVASAEGLLQVAGDQLLPVPGSAAAFSLARSGSELWIGGPGSVRRRLPDGSEQVHALPAGAGAVRVTRLATTPAGLWIGTAAGLFLLPAGADAVQAVALAGGDAPAAPEQLNIESLQLDRDGNLWIGTSAMLYWRRPDGRIEPVRNEDFVRNAYVVSQFEDREGNLWLGSRTEGLFRLWNGWTRRVGLREGLTDPLVWSIVRDPQDRIVFGSNSNVMRLEADGSLVELVSRQQLPGPAAYELAYDLAGRLWIGTRGGLVVREPDGRVHVPASLQAFAGVHVSVIAPLSNGAVWIGSHAGLYHLSPAGALQRIELAPGTVAAPIRALHSTAEGRLLVGTEAGVRELGSDGRLYQPDWAAPFAGIFVTAIRTIRPGLVGLATRDAGIALLGAGQRLQRYGVDQGLPSNNAWLLQVLAGQLYVATIDGVWRIPVDELPDPAQAAADAPGALLNPQIVLGRYAGAQYIHCCNGGASARVLVDGDGLWFAGIQGAVRIDSRAIQPPPLPPTVVVERLGHGGHWHLPGRPIAIDAARRDLEIQFTGLSFRDARNLQFRYRLEGYDQDWYEAGTRRSAFYTNLPPGQYRFLVEARSPAGGRQDASTGYGAGGASGRGVLVFELVPRWFERRGVHATGWLLLLGLAVLLPLGLRQRYQRRRLALEALVAERTHELREANARQREANQALNESNRQLLDQIDERAAAEAALQSRNAELSALNHKLEGTQNQLVQSEKMASVGQLAAGVAHEINNPIGYVHSNMDSLRRYLRDLFAVLQAYERFEAAGGDPGGAAQRELRKLRAGIDLDFLREDIGNLLDESLDGITRVEKIVRDLKEFSHLDEAEWQLADIHQCLDSTLNVAAHELKYKADLVKDYGQLPLVECLPFQLNQVFLNLLVNAAHAIEQRGTITLRTEGDAREVRISVSDTGRGIPATQLHRIFEPFFTTKPAGKGTGLGLSVSWGIVQKHGGRIEVQSEVGRGTTFTVHLPLKRHEV